MPRGPTVVLGGRAVSYERGTPVSHHTACGLALALFLNLYLSVFVAVDLAVDDVLSLSPSLADGERVY